MKQKTIDGYDIRNWFKSGLLEVDQHRAQIDSINVFPVADGDTGTNLAMTLRAMADRPPSTSSFGDMIARISETGLAHAHGNSGLIFASYISGIAQEGKIYEKVDLSQFSALAQKAVDYMSRAISHPVEGTMITVIRDWASFLSTNHHKFEFFEDLLDEAYEIARMSLVKTTGKLEILKKYNVVDAGAAGFVRFLKGINSLFTTDAKYVEEEIPAADFTDMEDDQASGYRYCTEFLISCSMQDPEKIRTQLDQLGDSVIISTGSDKIRIHVHTDHPEKIHALIKQYGPILEQNVDDMLLRHGILNHRKSDIAIMTDTIADLPDDLILEYQVHQVPLTVLADGVPYLDKRTIDLEMLFDLVETASVYPTSSQPEPARVSALLSDLSDHYGSIIAITVASKLSGTYGVVGSEAEKIAGNGKKVSVVDSRLNSGAQGLIVKKAAELIDQGFSHDDIIAQINEMIPKTKIYVCLETIDNAVRGGKVPNTLGRLLKAVGARPIMTLDDNGGGAAFGVGFSKDGMTRKIFRLARRIQNEKGIQAYSIVHAGNPDLAGSYAEFMKALTGLLPEFITEISSVTAIHSGRGCVALSIMER